MFHVGSHEGRVEWRPISWCAEKCQVTWGRKDGKIFDLTLTGPLFFLSPPQPILILPFIIKAQDPDREGGLLVGAGVGRGGGRVGI